MDDNFAKCIPLYFLLATLSLLSGCLENGGAVNYCAAPDLLVDGVNLSIDGAGLFVLANDTETLYSRKGAFCVDSSGALLHDSGRKASGFPLVGGEVQGLSTPLSLPVSDNAGAPLAAVTVDPQGLITAHYQMSSDQVVAQLALAVFPSPQNLLPVNVDLCQQTVSSGAGALTAPGPAGSTISQGALEGSYECDRGSVFFDTRIVTSGGGYFRLNDQGGVIYGSDLKLGLDASGFLVNAGNYRFTGYAADSAGVILPSLSELAVPQMSPPRATSTLTVSINLDAGSAPPPSSPFSPLDNASYNHSLATRVYDSLGAPHDLRQYFVKQSTPDRWEAYVYLDGSVLTSAGVAKTTLSFNADGSIASPTSVAYDAVAPGGGASALQLTFDYTSTTQNSAPFTAASVVQNGFASGRLSDIRLDAAGVLTGAYSSGRTGVVLGQFILAKFAFPLALAPRGDGSYLETADSGPPTLGVPGPADAVQLIKGTAP